MVSGGTVTGDLSSFKSHMNTLSSEVSSLSGSWMGASADSIIAQVEKIVSEYLNTISGQMSAFASACDLYVKYDETKKKLESARSNLNSTDDKVKSNARSQVSALQAELDRLKAEIEGDLASAGGAKLSASSVTSTVDASGASSTTTTSSLSGLTPKFGTFQKESFTASNGIKIDYLCYKPDYGTNNVSGLPVHMYMTGAGMKSTGEQIMTYGGVGKLLNEKKITPSGIVVVPYVPSGHEYENKEFRKALAELPVAVCKQNNGDLNRISLSGHSYGAITAYNLVNENPNTFSAIVPVSGSKPPTEAFKTCKVWAFHGAQDNPGNNTDYRKAVKNVQAIQAMGGSATMHAYTDYPNCYHTHTANYTFGNSFDDPDDDKDENVNPLEWAFKQVKG